ncbi:MAG TPA: carotenoid 1,2-hydratase [Polyangiaceae bacterium]|nr:carotenoid 1,2-hydratase [Polyangiaceae bacterium]
MFREYRAPLRRDAPDRLELGAGLVEFDERGLSLRFDERTSPFPRPRSRRLEGSLRLEAESEPSAGPYALDTRGAHLWWPVFGRARLRVDVPAERLGWSGWGYHDANAGDAPLGRAFGAWSWGRFHVGDETIVTYDARPRAGACSPLALAIGPGGGAAPFEGPTEAFACGRTAWGLPVSVRAERGAAPALGRALEDGPFYARHLVASSFRGRRVEGICETLSLERFEAPWVRFLLPFRLRRA